MRTPNKKGKKSASFRSPCVSTRASSDPETWDEELGPGDGWGGGV